ncbi:putative GNAT family N-acyltransferase [Paraburkholderia youngii]|uniref:N-acetyltransferase n=2 Tax=Paraburkholderia youngii TaxID=2782701 RepID=A0A7W8L821_9BURK|nr:N-acetyltransferase [Paraburkholderia youngii]MBB5402049.1 putative GNAT family N-acyltransferase [Paraburkholderia youngii]NVI02369.1 N-acetyltransferase [Paraburkholderia youngii]
MSVAFEQNGQLIGTMRFVPMTHDLTLTEKLQKGANIDPSLLEDSWEVGRLVLDPAFRHGQDLLKKCFVLALCFVCENSSGKNFHASCSYVLSRLYRRFGFSPIATNVPLPGSDKIYTLIHGALVDISRALMGSNPANVESV